MLEAKDMYRVMQGRISLDAEYSDMSAEDSAELKPENVNDGTQAENAITRRKLYLFEKDYMDRSSLADYTTIEGTTTFHSMRGCGDKSKILRRRYVHTY
jgi:hypothetical protein